MEKKNCGAPESKVFYTAYCVTSSIVVTLTTFLLCYILVATCTLWACAVAGLLHCFSICTYVQVNLKAIYTDLTSCARDVLTYITNYLERNCDTVGQAVCSEVQDKITAHLATQGLSTSLV